MKTDTGKHKLQILKEASLPELAAERGAIRYRAFSLLEAKPTRLELSAGWQRGPISARGMPFTAKMEHWTTPPPGTEIPTPCTSS